MVVIRGSRWFIRDCAWLVDGLLLLLDEVVAQIREDASFVVLLPDLVTLVREDGAPESRGRPVEAAHGVECVGSRAIREMVIATAMLIEAPVTAVMGLAVRVHHARVLAVCGALGPAVALGVLLGVWQRRIVGRGEGGRL